MGRYDLEYSKYYNSIENKSSGQKNYNRMKNGNKRNKKRSVIKESVDYSIVQCIITFIVLVTILAMKYSNDNKSVSAFNTFKENINEKSSYSEIAQDIGKLKFSKVKSSAVKGLKWIRENINETIEK